MRPFLRGIKTIGWLATALAASLLLIHCGGDDDDDGGGGDTRKILEIHILENVTPRPLPATSQAINAARIIVPVHGQFYRGSMGSSVLDNPLQFTLSDTAGPAVVGQRVNFALLEGDGTLSALADTTDAAGRASVTYGFTGSLGHAVLQATADSTDTATVYVRANTLIPGATGQGQYVLFEDTVGRVIDFNGIAEADTPTRLNICSTLSTWLMNTLWCLLQDSDSG